MRESDLFVPVKRFLEEQGQDVYSEVQMSRYSYARADVVGWRSPVLTVVEMKTSLSLDLLAQAVAWKEFANYIYIAIPTPKGLINPFALKLLRQEGIGLLTVSYAGTDQAFVEHRSFYTMAKLQRRILPYLKESLNEAHKSGPPGGHHGGGYVTPYRLMIKNVREYLTRKTADGSWVTVQDILSECETYYHTPRASLASALKQIEQSWCEHKHEKGRLYFRLRPETRHKEKEA